MGSHVFNLCDWLESPVIYCGRDLSREICDGGHVKFEIVIYIAKQKHSRDIGSSGKKLRLEDLAWESLNVDIDYITSYVFD